MAAEYDAVDYRVSAAEATHSTWNNALEPILTVEPGSVVRFECTDATGGQLGPESTVADLAELDVDAVHTLTGPIAVDGAEPGDVLEIEILDLEHRGWGYTLVLPGETGLGLLPEDVPEPALHVWDLEDGVARFVNGIEVPLQPFPGTVGVAPAEDGDHDTTPPRSVGGNLDIKHLSAGATLFLPVAVEGALFSVGDCHAAQGDGEVCVTGIEAPMAVTCRIDVRSDLTLEQPRFETDGPFAPAGRDGPAYGTAGVDEDPRAAAKAAVRGMIDHLEADRGLTREEAYILCSAAVDLKINQAVNEPNWTVSAYLPEHIFPDSDPDSSRR